MNNVWCTGSSVSVCAAALVFETQLFVSQVFSLLFGSSSYIPGMFSHILSPPLDFPDLRVIQDSYFSPNSSYLLQFKPSSPLTFSSVKVMPNYLFPLLFSCPPCPTFPSCLGAENLSQTSVIVMYLYLLAQVLGIWVLWQGLCSHLEMREHQGETEDREERGGSVTLPAHLPPGHQTQQLCIFLLLTFVVLLSENTSGFQDEVQGLTKTWEALYELFLFLPWPYHGVPDTSHFTSMCALLLTVPVMLGFPCFLSYSALCPCYLSRCLICLANFRLVLKIQLRHHL